MLVISRKEGESIKVAEDIEIIVISVDGHRVRLGIQAPKNIRILRSELDPAVIAANQTAVLKFQTPEHSQLLKLAAQAKRKGLSEQPKS